MTIIPGTADVSFTPPLHRTRIFILILIGTLCGQMGLSIISPFYPKEAHSKHVSDSILGWIFSTFELATMLSTLLATHALVILGTKPLLVAGNALGGLGNILLCFCWYVGEGVPFVICCLLLRALAGVAFALASTAGYCLLPALYGPAVSTASGTLEGVNGIAMILGPIIGSSLFSLGGGEDQLGYVVPFLVLGGIEFLFALLNFWLLPKLPMPPVKKPSLTCFSWKALVPCMNCVVNGINLGLLGPTLQPHLSAPPLNYSVQIVGFVFAAACAAYAVSAPVAGVLDDWMHGRSAVMSMAFGALLSSLGYACLGPVPIAIGGREMTLNSAFCWGGASLLGAGAGFGFTPVYKQMLMYAKHPEADERELATAALFTISLSMGSFLGPTLGGMLSESVGVRTAYTYSAFSLLGLSVLLASLTITPAFRTVTASAARAAHLLETEGIETLAS